MPRHYLSDLQFVLLYMIVSLLRYESHSGGEREIQRTLLELLNQLDGFDSRGDVKVLPYVMSKFLLLVLACMSILELGGILMSITIALIGNEITCANGYNMHTACHLHCRHMYSFSVLLYFSKVFATVKFPQTITTSLKDFPYQ